MMRKPKPTHRALCLEALEDRLCPSALPLGTPLTQPDTATQARASAAYGQLPLSFEANQGQTDASVNFLSRGSGYTLFLTPGEAVLDLQRPGEPGVSTPQALGDVLHIRLVGSNSAAQAIGKDTQAGLSNYLIGNDVSQWHTNIANYGRVEYQDIYAGIDVVYYGNQRQLEYDFVVAPGADPNAIKLSFEGVKGMTLDADGNLVLHAAGGDVVEHVPVVYQETDGVRQAVSGRYVLQDNGQVGFVVGAYDESKALTIDPILSYSTYLGGIGNDRGFAIAVDGAGNTYVTGSTTSVNFPTKGPVQATHGDAGNGWDAFVTKLDASGSAIVYSTFLGGSLRDGATGIALFTDASGTYAAVTGGTSSLNFPTKNAAQSIPGYAGSGTYTFDAFAALLTPSGSGLVYSTYLGGSGQENVFANNGGIAVDATGNVYVAGQTQSTNFPTANAFQSTLMGGSDAFLTKLSLAGALVYSTYFGGSGPDAAYAVAVDTSGSAYLTGWTQSLPTTPGAFQTALGGGSSIDAFVTKFNASGSALVYSTYLGGSNDDRGLSIAVDPSGNAYVTGYTYSTNFPTTAGVFQPAKGGSTGQDGFVTALNATGTALVYSSYLGGSADDQGYGIAVDAAGNAYVTGETASTNFTTVNAFQATYGGGSDAFVTNVNATGSGLFYSSYLGGNDWDRGQGIAVDGAGNAYVTGLTYSRNFPTTTNPLQSLINGKKGNKPVTISDAFVTKIGPAAAALQAVSSGNVSRGKPLIVESLQPLLAEASHRWQSAGVDVSSLQGIDIHIADLGGTTLGLAAGHTIWLDDNAAGWGWFVDRTPHDDREFSRRGNQGERNRIDLLSALMHEIGHLLGYEHDEAGVMAETLSAGTRPTLHGVELAGLSDLTKRDSFGWPR